MSEIQVNKKFFKGQDRRISSLELTILIFIFSPTVKFFTFLPLIELHYTKYKYLS